MNENKELEKALWNLREESDNSAMQNILDVALHYRVNRIEELAYWTLRAYYDRKLLVVEVMDLPHSLRNLILAVAHISHTNPDTKTNLAMAWLHSIYLNQAEERGMPTKGLLNLQGFRLYTQAPTK